MSTPRTTPLGEMPLYEELLRNVVVGLLIADRGDMVEISPTAKISDALLLMKKHNILALPVYDEFAKQYAGIVSTFDIVMYMVYLGYDMSTASLDSDRLNTPVGSVIGFDAEMQTGRKGSGIVLVDPMETVWDTMKRFEGGVDRVMVRIDSEDKDGKPGCRLLTATDIVRFLVGHLNALEDYARLSVAETQMLTPTAGNAIATVPLSAKTVLAFRTLYENHADAVGVVNENGALMSWLSASDMRGMGAQSFKQLDVSVEDFLRTKHYGKLRPPICVRPGDSVAMVMIRAVAIGTHRVWVIDESMKPIGCIRLNDMIAAIRQSGADSLPDLPRISSLADSRRGSVNPKRMSLTDALFL